MKTYTFHDLGYWLAKVEERACAMGLDCYPQEFEVVDVDTITNMAAYGMPSMYPHWSWGKHREAQATREKYGLGRIYEIVLNTNPALALLLDQASLGQNIMVGGHVYGHNDFFKNNVFFKEATQPDLILAWLHGSARRVRKYAADPAIGASKVEKVIDAAHALQRHIPRTPGAVWLSQEERKRLYIERVRKQPEDPWEHLSERKSEDVEGTLRKFPIEPEEHLLFFIRSYSPRQLEDWEKDVITIVAEREAYFRPQWESKIINEGWAVFCHQRIFRDLGLPFDLREECAKLHAGVVHPSHNPLVINPYHLGSSVWEDVFRRYEDPTKEERKKYSLTGGQGWEQVLKIRRRANDRSFLLENLTKELVEELSLFSYKPVGKEDEYEVDRIGSAEDDESWRQIKALLLRQVGVASVPIIRIVDADYDRSRSLWLQHEFDGRRLDREYTEKTLEHTQFLWGRPVYLETVNPETKNPYVYKYDGVTHTAWEKDGGR